jgi:hypothetical protein
VLAELDIRAGDRVLIMLPEGPGFTEVLGGVRSSVYKISDH